MGLITGIQVGSSSQLDWREQNKIDQYQLGIHTFPYRKGSIDPGFQSILLQSVFLTVSILLNFHLKALYEVWVYALSIALHGCIPSADNDFFFIHIACMPSSQHAAFAANG